MDDYAPVLFAENSPAWLCPTSPGWRIKEFQERSDPDLAEGVSHRQAMDRAARKRRIEKEKARRAAMYAAIDKAAAEKKAREELSQKNKAERAKKDSDEREARLALKRRAKELVSERIAKRKAEASANPPSQYHYKGVDPPEGYIGIGAAMVYSGLGRSTLNDAAQRGRLRYIKLGKWNFFLPADIDAYMNESKRYWGK